MAAARATAQGVAQLMGFYNSIEGIRRSGGTRADAWAEINGLVGEGYMAPDAATIFDMNEVWQRAGAVLASERAYSQARAEGALTGESWSWAPWVTPSTAEWSSSRFQIRYQYEVIDPEGGRGTFWGQTDWSHPAGIMPTLGDIQDRVSTSAQVAFDSYPSEFQRSRGIAEGSGLGDIVAVQLLRI